MPPEVQRRLEAIRREGCAEEFIGENTDTELLFVELFDRRARRRRKFDLQVGDRHRGALGLAREVQDEDFVS